MKLSIGDLRELDGPKIRFTLTITSDAGDPLMSYPGWTFDQYRIIESPATKTAKGFYKRFTSFTEAFSNQLKEALEDFPETMEILGPKLEKIKHEPVKRIKGERTIG